ncbi:c-type cytochrome [Rhizobium multihospitium]|uniref:Cytochrome c, mono-and diheme variants n=1 Tax=Rhizobium multihospitium TaxID=410764 RepID=A0A1C3UHS1_9HYPH|nr:cytochrome c [Rhizobium multihospitium]SCB14999.1 Cytochrome c, mono-and diheme variants [Rhizobium multihospitium]
MMKKLSILIAFGALSASASTAFADSTDLADRVINGRYQAVLGDCSACHTKQGGQPFAGGEPLQTPFGALVPPNITPDRETGIGNWSEADFIRMMKTGTGHDGIRLYPAMPYPAYSKMSDKDLSEMWAYLTTLQPVKNKVVANQLPFPLNIRLSMWGWNLLNFDPAPFVPDETQTAEWNRGAYLVQGPGHCATCHSPKSFLGADKDSQFLQGASLQGWYAPNITGDPHIGIGAWSEDDIVTYLKTGSTDKTIASGPMAEAIAQSTSQMKDADLKAIAVYLKSLSAGSSDKPAPLKADDGRMVAGAAIYHDTCSACHGMDGKGAMPLFPALAGNSLVLQSSAETLAHVVLAGSQAVHTSSKQTTPAMPSFAWRLNDQQVSDVLTYVRNSWGNAAAPVSAGDVSDIRGNAQD